MNLYKDIFELFTTHHVSELWHKENFYVTLTSLLYCVCRNFNLNVTALSFFFFFDIKRDCSKNCKGYIISDKHVSNMSMKMKGMSVQPALIIDHIKSN